jgi:hypothetical protein
VIASFLPRQLPQGLHLIPWMVSLQNHKKNKKTKNNNTINKKINKKKYAKKINKKINKKKYAKKINEKNKRKK